MTIKLSMPEITELKPRIVVMGIGGAGGNAVNNMIKSQLEGVEFVVANTDAQALAISAAKRRVQLGVKVTRGLGAGSRPEIGRAAADEAIDQIREQLVDCHMVFITAGMGGGTGTGAAPIVAQTARGMGVLTVGVVTKPFQFEGTLRGKIAERGIEELQQHVDTLIVIPNQNLFRVATEKTTFADAFAMADNVLHSGVRGITDLMVMPGLINLDFADVKSVIDEMGKAIMGTGEAEGDQRALEAAESAISNPLLDDVSMKGARGVLINITGGQDMTLFEVDEAANRIRSEVDPDANIIIGSAFNESLNGKIRVSVFATGIDGMADMTRVPAMIEPIPAIPETVAPAPAADAGTAIELPDAAIAAEADGGPAKDGDSVPAPGDAAPLEEPAIAAKPAIAKHDRYAPFVAPEPMRAGGEIARARAPEPFAEAAMANGAMKDFPGKRQPGGGFLQRMTGAKRGRHDQTRADAEAMAREKAAAEDVAPTLGRLDPADRISQQLDLEDQLEIPAFLRRQAN